MDVFYRNMSADFIESMDDPYIYPIKMSEETIRKLPPTVVVTGEFDCFRRDSAKFA